MSGRSKEETGRVRESEFYLSFNPVKLWVCFIDFVCLVLNLLNWFSLVVLEPQGLYLTKPDTALSHTRNSTMLKHVPDRRNCFVSPKRVDRCRNCAKLVLMRSHGPFGDSDRTHSGKLYMGPSSDLAYTRKLTSKPVLIVNGDKLQSKPMYLWSHPD